MPSTDSTNSQAIQWRHPRTTIQRFHWSNTINIFNQRCTLHSIPSHKEGLTNNTSQDSVWLQLSPISESPKFEWLFISQSNPSQWCVGMGGMLLLFCLHKFSVSTDIEKAFLHITLDDDYDYMGCRLCQKNGHIFV